MVNYPGTEQKSSDSDEPFTIQFQGGFQMSKCPECNTYSELKASVHGCLVCPNCKAMFKDEEILKDKFTNKEMMQQIHYLQTAILELGKTNINLMRKIKNNYRSIQRLRGKV